MDNIKGLREKSIMVALNKTAIVAETNIQGVITYVNDKFLEISEYSREEVLGRTHKIINSGYHPKSFMENLWKTINSGQVWRGEICNKTKSGKLYWVDTCIAPIFDSNNKVVSFIAIRFDITERKLLEEKLENEMQSHQESLSVLGQLAATVAHEINNPLAAISMFTQMMESDMPSDSPFQEHIAVIKRNTDSCKKTVQVLLNQSHRSKPVMMALELAVILDEIMIFLKPMCEKNEVLFRSDLRATLTQVLSDPVQLRQVFVNLLMNALQCFDGKKGLVTLRSMNSFDNKMVIVEVEDNGPGIPDEYKAKIFEPFFTTKELGKGTGLGLSNASRVIQANGGKLNLVKSDRGQTIFRVELPILKERKQ